MIMAEVTNQLGPLIRELSRVSGNQERLYNSNGGPPGFLQTARKEDKDTFDMIFDMVNEIKKEMVPLKEFARDHEVLDKDRDRRFDRRMAKWMLLFALLGTLFLIFDHRGAILHSLVAIPEAHSQLQQNATIPPLTR